jgi:hypothetical protein
VATVWALDPLLAWLLCLELGEQLKRGPELSGLLCHAQPGVH